MARPGEQTPLRSARPLTVQSARDIRAEPLDSVLQVSRRRSAFSRENRQGGLAPKPEKKPTKGSQSSVSIGSAAAVSRASSGGILEDTRWRADPNASNSESSPKCDQIVESMNERVEESLKIALTEFHGNHYQVDQDISISPVRSPSPDFDDGAATVLAKLKCDFDYQRKVAEEAVAARVQLRLLRFEVHGAALLTSYVVIGSLRIFKNQ